MERHISLFLLGLAVAYCYTVVVVGAYQQQNVDDANNNIQTKNEDAARQSLNAAYSLKHQSPEISFEEAKKLKAWISYKHLFINPTFDSVGAGRNASMGIQDFKITIQDLHLIYAKRKLLNDMHLPVRVTQIISDTMQRTRQDDIKFTADLLKILDQEQNQVQTLGANCQYQLFEASELIPYLLNIEPELYFVGITDTYLCVYKVIGTIADVPNVVYNPKYLQTLSTPTQKHLQETIQMCTWNNNFRPNVYQTTALAAENYHLNGAELTYNMYAFDETGVGHQFRLFLGTDMGTHQTYCENVYVHPDNTKIHYPPILTGEYQLDAHNRQDKTYTINGNMTNYKNHMPPEMVRSYESHFNRSFITAITQIDYALYYSRGRLLVDDNIVHREGGNYNMRHVPDFFLTTGQAQGKFSVQAMEIYTFDGRRYAHFAGIESEEKTNPMPVYYYCDMNANETFSVGSQPFDGPCKRYELPDMRMPIDFAFYYTDKCNAKLLVFYPYMVRMLEPNENLFAHAAQRKLELITWMPDQLRAVMFHKRRFYLFLAGNRLLIEKNPRTGSCPNLLEPNEPHESGYGSELVFQYENDVRGLNRLSTTPYDGYRYFVASLEEFRPPNNPSPLKKEFRLLSERSIGGSSEGSSFPTVLIVCILLIVAAIIGGVIYYFFYSGGESDQITPIFLDKKPRKKTTQEASSLTASSALSAQPTARSSIVGKTSSPQASATTPSVKSIRSPISPQKHKSKSKSQSPAAKALRRSKSSASPISKIKSNKSVKSTKSNKSLKRTKSSPASPKS